MSGIFYKKGIYVLVDSNDEHDNCVFRYGYKQYVELWGGRVVVRGIYNQLYYLAIDGIGIIDIQSNTKKTDLSLSQIVSHLNAIEANGVDAFLQNYKLSVEFVYDELKNICQMKTEQLALTQDDSKIKILLSELEKLNNLLLSILTLLFSLRANMLAELENEKVISVYQSIMDSLL